MKKHIAIIGGGIVGLSTAFYLSQEKDIQVSLFDFDKGQATKVTGGVICPWLSQRRNKDWYQLVRQSAAFYPQFIKDIGEDPKDSDIYKRHGGLIFKKKASTLQKTFDMGKERLKDAPEMIQLKILEAEDIQELLPIYDKDRPAIYVEGGGRADGARLVHHLQELIQENGVHFYQEHVNHLTYDHHKYHLVTDQQEHVAQQVVLSNGAWLGETLEELNYQVDCYPQKGQIAEVYLDVENSESWPIMMPAGGNNIIPMEKGKILIGATHEKDEGFSTEIIPERAQVLVDDAAEQISDQFLSPQKVDYQAGIRGYTSDFSPFFGRVEGPHPDLYAINGLGATGLTAGPLIGKSMAQLILGQKTDLNLSNYSSQAYIQYKGD